MTEGNQPIKAIGTYLYQLEDSRQCNLWGGSLNAHNENDPEHVERVIKLILAAQDMLEALEHAQAWFSASDLEHLPVAQQITAAIAKATK